MALVASFRIGDDPDHTRRAWVMVTRAGLVVLQPVGWQRLRWDDVVGWDATVNPDRPWRHWHRLSVGSSGTTVTAWTFGIAGAARLARVRTAIRQQLRRQYFG